MIIDFDNPNTFPLEIKNWVLENRNYFEKLIPQNSQIWEISSIIQDAYWELNETVLDFIKENTNTEFCVWHCTRIDNISKYRNEGIIDISKDSDSAKERYALLLTSIGLVQSDISVILEKMQIYWKRDFLRTDTVHFFYAKEQIENPTINIFAINLGGEILRWALLGIDKKLYKKEPYKRLWIRGTPCIVKFKCKLKDMIKTTQEHSIIEIIKHFVITEIFDLPYKIECTGTRIGFVAPNDILSIEEIDDFVKMQEQFDEYKNFYES